MFLQVKYNPLLQICSASVPTGPPSSSHILQITSDSGTSYLGWNGTCTYNNVLEISTVYASKIGLKLDEWVSADWVIADLIDNIEVAPADEDSWEVVSKNVKLIENILLTQIQVVFKQQEFPIWIGAQAQCTLKVVNISREYGKLGVNTELYVQVKERKAKSSVQDREQKQIQNRENTEDRKDRKDSDIQNRESIEYRNIHNEIIEENKTDRIDKEEISIPEGLKKERLDTNYYDKLTNLVCEELAELYELGLSDDISVIEGCSGSGKSSLLSKIANKMLEKRVESYYIECNKLSMHNNQHLNSLQQAFTISGSKKSCILMLDNIHILASKPELFEGSVGDKLTHCLSAVHLSHLKESFPHLKLLITCHDIENLHPEVKRSNYYSECRRKYKLPPLSLHDRREFFEKIFNLPELSQLSESTSSYLISDIFNFHNFALHYSFMRNLPLTSDSLLEISKEYIPESLDDIKIE
jgi:DNA replication protein DnaC